MNNLKVGYSRLNITPMLGIDLGGYPIKRQAEKILDDLYVFCVALNSGDDTALILAVDNLSLFVSTADRYREAISKKTSIPKEAIYISCSHNHTSPGKPGDTASKEINDYYDFLEYKMVDSAVLAIADLKDARMGYGIGEAKGVAFPRRYRMKDGSCQTNPGVNNPDILHSIGTADERVTVIRFDREGADTIVIANFGNHPDTIGGCVISSDWPHFLRETVESVIPNCKCVFLNGAQGDLNHVNVHPTGGFYNDLARDFDDVDRGYGHTRWMGRVVGAGVLQVFDKVEYVDVDSIKYIQKTIEIPSNRPDPKDIPEARRIDELYSSGRASELPYKGMMLTTVVAEARRMLRLENGPDYFDMNLIGISVGGVAFLGIPGEPFSEVGKQLKNDPNFTLVVPTALTNGSQGYFPTRDAYDEGGYEARGSRFKAGVAELIIEEGKKLLTELWNK